MRGEFIGVWSETWREIWLPLIDYEDVPEDIFCELYRVLAGDPKRPGALGVTPTVETLAEIVDDPLRSREAFERTTAQDLAGERSLVTFLEFVHDALEEVGSDKLTNRYFNLLVAFIDKFSLRYDLRRPCILCPTLPGVFASLMRDLRTLTSRDGHLSAMMRDFEESIRDLRHDCSEGRIKTCIQKEVNLLEAVGQTSPGVTQTELGAICNEIGTWPHATIKAALRNLYGFASNYPGIRHGGNPTSALRDISMRDMIAVSVVLAGFAPYLSEAIDPDVVYGGA